jgi:hypothetical protein
MARLEASEEMSLGTTYDQQTAALGLAVEVEGDVYLETIGVLERAGVATPVSLNLPADLTYEQWEQIGHYLGRLHRTSRWLLADWILYGEGAFGERYAQAVDATLLSKKTLENYVSVAKSVPPSRRKESLSFSTHAEVAPLDAGKQRTWLARAETEKWSSRELRAALKEAGQVDEREQPDWTRREPRRVRLERAARDCVAGAVSDGVHVRVPLEPWARLVEAVQDE